MVANVGSNRQDYERARALEGKMSCRAASRIVGVPYKTIWNWWKRKEPPRQVMESVTIEDLGISKCDGKLCRRCGRPMMLKTAVGLCLECRTAELVKQGAVKCDG